jgi:hypothetical protein
MSKRRALSKAAYLAVSFCLVAVLVSDAAFGEEPSQATRVATARRASLSPAVEGPVLAVSRNTLISVLATGATVIAIVTGSVGMGTVAAYLLNRTIRNKGLSLAVLVVSLACAVIVSWSVAPRVYITVNAWLGRE